mgnify:CR=1 FL=1
MRRAPRWHSIFEEEECTAKETSGARVVEACGSSIFVEKDLLILAISFLNACVGRCYRCNTPSRLLYSCSWPQEA